MIKQLNVLLHSVIKLLEEEGKLSWFDMGIGVYTTKLRYATQVENDMQEEIFWWWRLV